MLNTHNVHPAFGQASRWMNRTDPQYAQFLFGKNDGDANEELWGSMIVIQEQ